MAEERSRLLVATTNEGKLAELNELLSPLKIELLDLSSIDDVSEVPEVGETFAANAALKASEYARRSRMLTIADDSGLEVAALDGRPGVYTARYAGEDTGFDHKMATLIDELANAPSKDRSARFVCAVAIAAPDGDLLFTGEGVCTGRIAHEPRGQNGFGFDPVFIPDGMDLTFGELSVNVKQQISHRARAFAQIMPFLCGFEGILT
jgi:XTP/dITP diphosphohydrolase